MDKETGEKLDQFFAKYKLVSFDKKSTIIFLADEPDGVYYLKEGFVKMNTILGNGNELILNIYKPGSYFPMFWALGEVPNNYGFETITNVKLYKAPRKDVLEFLKENQEISFNLIKRILSGVDGLLTNYNHLLVGNSNSRVASALLIASKRFGIPTKDAKLLINLKLTHQDIANLAGISRETASIAIERLLKRKIIEQRKRSFVILDTELLTNETAMDGEDISSPTVL